MKQYGVKCGHDFPKANLYSNIARARRHMKHLKDADRVYDIPRSDDYYKIVEREVTPWSVVKEETK